MFYGCVLPRTCCSRCASRILRSPRDGSSRLIYSLLHTPEGSYMALQKMFDFLLQNAASNETGISFLTTIGRKDGSIRAHHWTELSKRLTKKILLVLELDATHGTAVEHERGSRSLQRDIAGTALRTYTHCTPHRCVRLRVMQSQQKLVHWSFVNAWSALNVPTLGEYVAKRVPKPACPIYRLNLSCSTLT